MDPPDNPFGKSSNRNNPNDQTSERTDKIHLAPKDSFHLSSFFKNDKFSDVTIVFSGRKIKCHKMIICTRSKYFNDLCGPDSKFSEAQQKEPELKGDPPDAVEAILADLYDIAYHVVLHEDTDWPMLHHDVIITALKYQMPELAEKALESLTWSIYRLTNPASLQTLINKHEPYKGVANKGLDQLIANTEEHNLSLLMTLPAYREKLTTDEKLQQLLVNRLTIVDNFSQIQVVKCIHCGDSILSAVNRLACPQCSRILRENDDLTQDADRVSHWRKFEEYI